MGGSLRSRNVILQGVKTEMRVLWDMEKYASRPCYLFELDSACKTEEEIERGIGALSKTLLSPENYIVLSFNQFGDGEAVIRCCTDERCGSDFIELFERGRIRIARYGEIRTVADYLIRAMKKAETSTDPSRGFLFSSLEPLKDLYGSSASEGGKERSRRILSEMRRALEVNDVDAFGTESEAARELFNSEEEREYIARYLGAVLRISAVPALHVGPKLPGSYKTINEILKLSVCGLSQLKQRGNFPLLERFHLREFQALIGKHGSRSGFFAELDDLVASRKILFEEGLFWRRVVTLAYNHAVRSSIEGLSFEASVFGRDLERLLREFGTIYTKETSGLLPDYCLRESRPMPWRTILRLDDYARGAGSFFVGSRLFRTVYVLSRLFAAFGIFIFLALAVYIADIMDARVFAPLTNGQTGGFLVLVFAGVVSRGVMEVLEGIVGSPSYGRLGRVFSELVDDLRVFSNLSGKDKVCAGVLLGLSDEVKGVARALSEALTSATRPIAEALEETMRMGRPK